MHRLRRRAVVPLINKREMYPNGEECDSEPCSPCMPNEQGEKWLLEVESWTVDGEPYAFEPPDGGLYVSNPIPRVEGGNADASMPDEFIEASLADPRVAGAKRLVRMSQVNP